MPETIRQGIERLNPDGLPAATGYCQVTVAAGTRIAHVSGQVGIDAEGGLIGPLIGVAALADPRLKVEIEATAVLP
ncbi:MAG: hypothetical protein M3400_14635 [Actinomycetota bacterium]|nr:hypothetical protein [Actinomycetota bacterium]